MKGWVEVHGQEEMSVGSEDMSWQKKQDLETVALHLLVTAAGVELNNESLAGTRDGLAKGQGMLTQGRCGVPASRHLLSLRPSEHRQICAPCEAAWRRALRCAGNMHVLVTWHHGSPFTLSQQSPPSPVAGLWTGPGGCLLAVVHIDPNAVACRSQGPPRDYPSPAGLRDGVYSTAGISSSHRAPPEDQIGRKWPWQAGILQKRLSPGDSDDS